MEFVQREKSINEPWGKSYTRSATAHISSLQFSKCLNLQQAPGGEEIWPQFQTTRSLEISDCEDFSMLPITDVVSVLQIPGNALCNSPAPHYLQEHLTIHSLETETFFFLFSNREFN